MPNPVLVIISILILLGIGLAGWKMIAALRSPRVAKVGWYQKRIDKHLKKSAGDIGREISLDGHNVSVSYVDRDSPNGRVWDPSHYPFTNIFFDDRGKSVNPIEIKEAVREAEESSDDPAIKIEPSTVYAAKTGQTWIEQAFSKGLKQWIIAGAIAAGMAAMVGIVMVAQNVG